jgi:hypothetical protein
MGAILDEDRADGARASGACTELQADHRRPGLLARLWLHCRALNLRWSISSTEQYMVECERDGILAGGTLQAWHHQMQADRVELALIEAQLSPPPAREPVTHAGPLVRAARDRQLDAVSAGIWYAVLAALCLWGLVALVLAGGAK